ncbi:MAG: tRNA pseudouridine(55) synthase TruB [Kiritimatiellia bacterium]|jgi:tRNA pseudouridine55 synthase
MSAYSSSRSFSSSPDPDGILLVDKPAGMTSHDVVNAVRKMFKIKKAGHGGTLDPSATGLLVLLLGKGTKLADRVMGGDKVYEGVMRLGFSTTTQDADGERVSGSDPSGVTEEALREATASLTGDIYQTPPMVSALKKDGVPLYKLARKGEVVEREPRLVHIYRFDVVEFGIPDCRILVKCTKGTYVRTLCHDVGEKLGCGAHLASLRRTESGKFTVDKAIAFEDLKTLPRADLPRHVLPLLAAMN